MKDLLQHISDSVFKVNTSTGTGSGFYLKADNIIITNFHVVKGHREVAVETRAKMRYLAKVVFVNPDTDLAFLQPSRVLKHTGSPDSFANVEARESVTISKFKNAENPGFAVPIDILKEDLETFKLNKDFKFSVKCNFCKSLVFEQTNYCKNCGHIMHASVFERFNPDSMAAFIEDALILMGLNPVLARGGQDYWEFYHGSSLINIYFHNDNYVYAMSPINQLAPGNPDKLYKYLLSKPLSTYRLGVKENNIVLSYRFYLGDIYSWNAMGVMKDLAMFALKADEMSIFFKDYFGCGLSNYSRETGIAEEEANPGLLAVSYSSRADSLKNIGKWEEALVLHKKAGKIYDELGDDPAKARSWASQAQILEEKIKWEEALELHRKVEKVYEDLGDKIAKAGSIINQAQIIAKQGKWEEAKALYRKAARIYEEMNHRHGLARGFQSQARTLMEEEKEEEESEKEKENKFMEAMNLLERAEKLYEQLGDYWGFIKNNNLMVDLLIKVGRFQQASTIPNRVQRFLYVSARRLESAMFYGARAQFFRYHNLLNIALDFAKRELRCYLELDHRQGQAYSFVRQAEILTEQEEFANALGVCRKAQAIYEELAHQEGLAAAYSEMALLLMIMGKEEESLNLQKKVGKIFEHLDDPEVFAYKCHRYSYILYKRKKWVKSLEFGKKAEKTFETLGNREMLASIYEIRALIILDQWQKPREVKILLQLLEIPGNIYEQEEPKLEKNPGLLDQAMKLIQKTEDIYKQLDKKKELAYTWWNKGSVYIAQKNYNKGFEQYEKAIQRLKELELPYKDNEKKLVELRRTLPYQQL